MGQLMSLHVNKEESKNVINSIFPPQYYGYGKQGGGEQTKEDQEFNKEIDSLLRKYSAAGNYRNYGNEEALMNKVGYDN